MITTGVIAALSDADLQALGQCVAAAASLLALPYIALQLYQAKKEAADQARVYSEQAEHQFRAIEGSTRAAKASVYQGFTDMMVKIDMCFIAHPELRPYFYGKQDFPPGAPEDQRVIAMAETLRDLQDHVLRHEHFLEPAVFAGWKAYFSFLCEHGPVFRRFCSLSSDWYVETGLDLHPAQAPARETEPPSP
jgi:hypothetical protein